MAKIRLMMLIALFSGRSFTIYAVVLVMVMPCLDLAAPAKTNADMVIKHWQKNKVTRLRPRLHLSKQFVNML